MNLRCLGSLHSWLVSPVALPPPAIRHPRGGHRTDRPSRAVCLISASRDERSGLRNWGGGGVARDVRPGQPRHRRGRTRGRTTRRCDMTPGDLLRWVCAALPHLQATHPRRTRPAAAVLRGSLQARRPGKLAERSLRGERGAAVRRSAAPQRRRVRPRMHAGRWNGRA